MKNDYNKYLKNVQLMAKKDPKFFWKFINSKRKDNSIPNEMFLDDRNGNDGESISNLFSTNFKSVYRTSTSHFSQPNQSQCSTNYKIYADGSTVDNFTIAIEPDEIFTALKNLKNSYHGGTDGIPSSII